MVDSSSACVLSDSFDFLVYSILNLFLVSASSQSLRFISASVGLPFGFPSSASTQPQHLDSTSTAKRARISLAQSSYSSLSSLTSVVSSAASTLLRADETLRITSSVRLTQFDSLPEFTLNRQIPSEQSQSSRFIGQTFRVRTERRGRYAD